MEVDPLEDETLEVRSKNDEPKRLRYITLKYELLQYIFCLGKRSLGNCQKTSLFSHLNSL